MFEQNIHIITYYNKPIISTLSSKYSPVSFIGALITGGVAGCLGKRRLSM
jgi:hypothetical protein